MHSTLPCWPANLEANLESHVKCVCCCGGPSTASVSLYLPAFHHQALPLDPTHAGSLPTWNNLPETQVYVAPGNEDLCGEVRMPDCMLAC